MIKEKQGAPQGSRHVSVHEFTIGEILRDYPEAKTRGFRRDLLSFQRRNGAWPEVLWKGGFRPDLFWIDDRANVAFVVEVEDTSRVSGMKLNIILQLRETLFCDEMDLALITSDRWGNLTPVSLCFRGDGGWGPYGNAIFDLTKIGCVKDRGARETARKAWFTQNPDMDWDIIRQERRLDRRREERGLGPVSSMA